MKAPITIENYEAWLLDYLEGRLGAEETARLRAFAMSHPELDIDLDAASLPVMDSENIRADFRESLLRDEHDHPHEDLIAYMEGQLDADKRARLEKELAADPSLAAELASYRDTVLRPEGLTFPDRFALRKTSGEQLAGDAALASFEASLNGVSLPLPGDVPKDIFERELRLVAATRLQPDHTIAYPGKAGLKRGRVLMLFASRNVLRAAAVLALVAGLVTLLYNLKTSDPRPQMAAVENTPGPVAAADTSVAPVPAVAVRPIEQAEGAKVRGNSGEVRYKDVPAPVSNEPAAEVIENPLALDVPPEKAPEPVEAISSLTPAIDTAAPAQLAVMEEKPVPTEELLWLEEEDADKEPARNTFWQRLASLAGQANKLGVKAIDGTPAADDGFRLSLFAYSVEKK